MLLRRVRDVFEEDKAEDHVFVLGSVHFLAELVGGEPEFGFEPKSGVGIFFGGSGARGHEVVARCRDQQECKSGTDRSGRER
jgi:hypothetical protein